MRSYFFISESIRSRVESASLKVRMKRSAAFTLTELLVVMALIISIAGLAKPAFVSLTSSKGVGEATFKVSSALDIARAYAMANKTYVWVGFFEESVSSTTPTTSLPPYSGKGRVVIATVASKDGTPIFSPGDPAAVLPGNRIFPIGKIEQIQNAHLGDIGEPAGGSTTELASRPDYPYTDVENTKNRISSDSGDKTDYPFSLGGYTFHKTICFSPRGEADINSGGVLRNVGEIGILPTHGQTVAVGASNIRAVQFTGITGHVKVYAP